VQLLKFILRRVLQAIPMMVALVTLVFFVSRLFPGDPARLYISPGIPSDVSVELRSQFGLDRPLAGQYVAWLAALVRGDLGISFTHHVPVTDVLLTVVPNTLVLGCAALICELALAMLIAAVSAAFPGSAADRLFRDLTLVVYSLPSFWIGIILITVFSTFLGWFPSAQMTSLGPGGEVEFVDLLRHLVLPALTVAIPGAAAMARYVQTSVDDTLRQEHVVAATSMGLSKTRVMTSYVFPNAAGPAISVLGLEMGVVLTGVLVTETLFAWPGMGRIAVAAMFARDYPLILGCTVVGGIIVVAANTVADILRAWLDPRIRMDQVM
jgi:peptide/nickel transport system permease protein